MVASKQKKYWVICTQDLPYDFCGLGTTKDEAKRAIWGEVQRTNNNGYGLPPYGQTMKDFFDNYLGSSYQLAVGEAKSE